MLRDDVKITKQSEERRYMPDGTVTASIRVEFYVAKHGPFVERFHKENFTAAARDLKLEQFAQEIRLTP